MVHSHKILNISNPNRSLQQLLSKELGISKFLAQLLINRGMHTVSEASKFLFPRLDDLASPYTFRDMSFSVAAIREAISRKDQIMIFSDYDVDGLTSLALVKDTLLRLGAETTHYIPNRVKEGYGLNENVLKLTRQHNVKLLITADCGTNSDKYIQALMHNGIRVIVTDHHEPPFNDTQCVASAIINPKLSDSGYPFRDLAGVGVAYKLCQALADDVCADDLDLVALGTIADAVPLRGENRIIAKEGLPRLTATKRLGLKTLIETSGIKNKKIVPSFVSYVLGPRINASGRVDTAEVALHLLMSQDQEAAYRLAKTIEQHNRQRQKIESTILKEAQDLIDREINFKEHNIMVVAKEGWHTGVLGIVAAKLAERFYRPTILISLTEDLCKGSGRSIKNFHLFEAILECKDLLESFGGHQHATGLSIMRNNLGDFKEKINRLAKERLTLEELLPSVEIDMELHLLDLTRGFIEELQMLEPFGVGNREPLFFTRSLQLKGEPRVLGRDTLKCWVSDGSVTYEAIGFGIGNLKESLIQADCFNLVYTPRIDSWQGTDSIILEIKEIFFAS